MKDICQTYRQMISEAKATPELVPDMEGGIPTYGASPISVMPGEDHPGGTILDKVAYLIYQYWNQSVPPAPSTLDFNGDGFVDAADLGMALAIFGDQGSENDWSDYGTPYDFTG